MMDATRPGKVGLQEKDSDISPANFYQDRHSLLPSGAHKVILVLMTSHRQIQSFCFSFLQNDFSKANAGQNATNTTKKPPQCLKARDRGLGGDQAQRLKLTKATR